MRTDWWHRTKTQKSVLYTLKRSQLILGTVPVAQLEVAHVVCPGCAEASDAELDLLEQVEER